MKATAASGTTETVSKFAGAPIHLAVSLYIYSHQTLDRATHRLPGEQRACRLIHESLTSAKARRVEKVNCELLNKAWQALEECWVELESLPKLSPPPMFQPDDVVRFADGWVRAVNMRIYLC